jgi:hypothetical protein
LATVPTKIELLRDITVVKTTNRLLGFGGFSRCWYKFESKARGDLLAIVWLNALGRSYQGELPFGIDLDFGPVLISCRADKLLAPGEMERVGDAESEEWDNLHLLLLFDYLLHLCLRPPA